MSNLGNAFRRTCGAMAIAATVGMTGPASADPTQLGFILDSSGSIGSGNWATIVNGLANAIAANVPTGSLYEISVVSFSTTATINVDSFLVTDAASLTTLANLIKAIPFQGGSTDMAAGFNAMQTALFTTPTTWQTNGLAYVNLSTDGVPNDTTAATTARNNLIAAGADNISIEGIGSGVNATYLKGSLCYPQACDDTSPYNFPTQGFYIGIASAADYAIAIQEKIITVTKVPEPATLGLIGIALAGLAFSRRRQQA